MSDLAVVVGGGITGVISSLVLRKMNYDVELYESRSELGGIVLDKLGNGECYFNSCQYLNSQSDWTNLLEDFSMIESDHKYGSYTDLWGEEVIRKDFAGPVYDDVDIKFGSINEYKKTLSGRILAYPEKISQELLSWVSKFSFNPDEVYEDGVVGLQLSRIFMSNLIQETLDFKSNNRIADELYGLPRNMLGLQPLKVTLPKFGYRYFFSEIISLLKKYDVKINLKHAVKPQWKRSKLKVVTRNKSIDADLVVWAANPTSLIKSLNNIQLDSPVCRMRILWGNLLRCNELLDPFYIQVYSKYIPITRIFVYSIDGVNKISIEAFEDDCKSDEIITWGVDILKKFSIYASVDWPSIGNELQKRYFLSSVRDFQVINKFIKDTNDTNLIHGGWHLYGRDQKISAIQSQLSNKEMTQI